MCVSVTCVSEHLLVVCQSALRGFIPVGDMKGPESVILPPSLLIRTYHVGLSFGTGGREGDAAIGKGRHSHKKNAPTIRSVSFSRYGERHFFSTERNKSRKNQVWEVK
jgi:hypothetical protein